MRFFHYFYQIKLLWLVLIFSVNTALIAQQINSKLRLANVLEKNYQYESALMLYKELYSENRNDFTVIQGIKNCYHGLQDYENLIIFLNNVINQFPNNSSYQVDLGETYFLSDNKDRANEIWKSVIDKNITNIAVYRQVAITMIRQRLYDEAIDVYKQAIAKMSDQSNLHIEIANIYKAQLAYGKAAQHYLYYYQLNTKQKTFVQREILKLTDSPEHIPQIMNTIIQYLAQNEGQNEIREILAGLYIKEKRFTEAFDLYKELEKANNKGNYLQRFALEAFQNKAFNFAIDAYILIEQQFPQTPQSIAAQFQIALCQSLLAFQHREKGFDAQAAQQMAEAQNGFKKLVQTASIPSFVADSYIKLGDIAVDFYFDLDQAEYYYQLYLRNPKGSVAREEVIIKLADVYLMKNNLEKAQNFYRGIQHKSYQIQSEFKRLNVVYYQCQFSEALTGYDNLLKKIGTKHILANDILARVKLIRMYQTDSTSLVQYVNAELLAFQQKQAESAERLIHLFNKHVEISPRAGRDAVHILLFLKRYADARNLLLSHYDLYPENTFNDEVLFYLANSEEFLGNVDTAISRYKELLVKFPNSLYSFDARERARKLTEKLNAG